jgi:hypothetical protein
MTRTSNARVAGSAFLLYIALGLTSVMLWGRATGDGSVAAKLARMHDHVADMQIAIVLTLACSFAAVVLGVTLHALTRDEDRDIAMLGMACRVGEGVMGGLSLVPTLGLFWLGTTRGPAAPAAVTAETLGAYLFAAEGWSPLITAMFFAVGSTAFSWLLLRGRMIPAWMAWLGVVASVLLVATLPLQLIGVFRGIVAQLVWLPMLVFEVLFAFWLLIKGTTPRTER